MSTTTYSQPVPINRVSLYLRQGELHLREPIRFREEDESESLSRQIQRLLALLKGRKGLMLKQTAPDRSLTVTILEDKLLLTTISPARKQEYCFVYEPAVLLLDNREISGQFYQDFAEKIDHICQQFIAGKMSILLKKDNS